jgi:hypothetical protein
MTDLATMAKRILKENDFREVVILATSKERRHTISNAGETGYTIQSLVMGLYGAVSSMKTNPYIAVSLLKKNTGRNVALEDTVWEKVKDLVDYMDFLKQEGKTND